MTPDIPQNIVIAGLIGCLLALIVATAQQQWRPRVFFLLALRLAIGWQFMSEGMNKIQSHMSGAAGSGKPFSSEVYFRESEGPLGGVMRSMYLGDPDAELTELTTPAGNPQTVGDVLGAEGIAEMKADLAKRSAVLDVARMVTPPPPAGVDLPEYYAKTLSELPLAGQGAKFLAAYPPIPVVEDKKATPAQRTAAARKALTIEDLATRIANQCPTKADTKLKAVADQVIAEAQTDEAKDAAKDALFAARWLYARWVLGLDAEASDKKYISGDVVQTVHDRVTAYEHRKLELEQLKARRKIDLGRTTLFARIAETKADMTAVQRSLISEAEGLIDTARGDIAGAGSVTLPEEPAKAKKIETLDALTMWTLTIAGACLFFGLGTRIAALVCGGFLVMTYLTYPPLPWLPNPPGTEGNPVFINKNAIEMLACFALACLPTGLWMGIDSLIYKIVYGDRAKAVVL